MTQASWDTLQRLEQNIEARFTNNCTTANCPQPGRLHLLYAHYAERPDVDTVMNAWAWPTLTAYEAAEEPRHANVYRDYLGARLLWIQTEDAQIDDLPNLRQPVAHTVADGGTLIHFASTNTARQVNVTTGAPVAADNETYHPPRRRLCLSVAGADGSHLDVDAPRAGGRVTGLLAYPEIENDPQLRLYGIMPGFSFTLGGIAVGTTDPWSERPDRAANLHHALSETSTPLALGTVRSYTDEGITYYGIQRSGGVSTSTLGDTFTTQLGQSRTHVFHAISGIEGNTGSLNSYDGAKLSWGINQWNRLELWQILAFISDFYAAAFKRCFEWFGVGVRYTSRANTWTALGTYRNVTVFRVPCCGRRTRAALDAILAGTSDDNGRSRLATATALNQRRDMKSYAMHYLFAAAGEDADIQEAQAQWMSFRITSTSPVGKTINTVIDQFLRSLGSNVDPDLRLSSAQDGLGQGAAGILAQRFSDTDATQSWIDWPTRIGHTAAVQPGGQAPVPHQRPPNP